MEQISDPALIVIDMQKDFCKPQYAQGVDSKEVQSAVRATGEFLKRYRKTGRKPILIKNIHGPDVDSEVWNEMYAKNERTKPCVRGTEGAEFVPELKVKESDIIVTKNRYDAFYGTNLETYLSSNNISEVLIAGVQTNVCVDTTVRSAFIRNYDVTVLKDCVGTPDSGRSEVIFENIEQYFGRIRESTDIDLQ